MLSTIIMYIEFVCNIMTNYYILHDLSLEEAVRRNILLRDTTDVDISASIRDWLKYAKDRDGGRKERAERKRQQELQKLIEQREAEMEDSLVEEMDMDM